jgi:hypothetical protein
MYVENSGLLRCADAVSLHYWFPTFRKILMQLSSKAKQTKNNMLACLALDTPEDCLSNDRAWNPGRHEPKATRLRKPQILHLYVFQLSELREVHF